MSLPIYKSDDSDFVRMQNVWASQLNPVLANPLVKASILKNVTLVSGLNTVNHLLGQKLQGWVVVRLRGPANIYDTQDTNPTPALTLTLMSDASVVVDLEVF